METITPYRARLLADVISGTRHARKGEPELYGKRFDLVMIVADHENVLIAEGADKIRFPVKKINVQAL